MVDTQIPPEIPWCDPFCANMADYIALMGERYLADISNSLSPYGGSTLGMQVGLIFTKSEILCVR